LVGAVTLLLIARTLGLHDFGVFAAVLGIAQAGALLLDAGPGAFLLRELSRSGSTPALPEARLLTSVLWIEARIVAAVLAGVLLVGLVTTDSASLVALAAVLTAYVGLLGLATALESYFRARRQVKTVGVASLLEKLVALVGVVALSVRDVDGMAVVGAVLLLSAATRVVFDVLLLPKGILRRDERRSPHRDDAVLARRMFPFVATSAAIGLIPRLTVTAVAVVSTAAAAYYALAERLVTSLAVYAASLNDTLYPHVASGTLHARRANIIQVAVGVAGSALVAVLAAPVLEIAFGSTDAVSVNTVRIMGLSLPFIFVSGGLLVQAYMQGLESRTSRFAFAPTVLGTLAIVGGVAAWGTTGGAVGYVVRQTLICASLALVLRRVQFTSDLPLALSRGRVR
jgi:O-antigen/teichoic acid export membrane protein